MTREQELKQINTHVLSRGYIIVFFDDNKELHFAQGSMGIVESYTMLSAKGWRLLYVLTFTSRDEAKQYAGLLRSANKYFKQWKAMIEEEIKDL